MSVFTVERCEVHDCRRVGFYIVRYQQQQARLCIGHKNQFATLADEHGLDAPIVDTRERDAALGALIRETGNAVLLLMAWVAYVVIAGAAIILFDHVIARY